jgi:hypothetical protein
MKTAMIILITSITALLNTLAFADSHAASSNAVDGPCPEFNNNQYMKWIDLDASCKTRQQFISHIESEGLWDIFDVSEDANAVLLVNRIDLNEIVMVRFDGLWNQMGASSMQISKTFNCVDGLRQLERMGMPRFSDDYYLMGSQFNIYWPIKIGNTIFAIGAEEPSETCEFAEYLTL